MCPLPLLHVLLLSSFHIHWDYEPRTSETAPPRCCRHLAGSAFRRLVCRQDAGSTLGFLESLLSLSRVHLDHGPFHTPGQGTRPTSCRPGALTGRFMESLLSLSRMYWDHGPFHTPGQGTRPTSCRPGALTGRFM